MRSSLRDQLPLPFKHLPQFHQHSYVVGEGNKLAFQWLQEWPNWSTPGLVIHGPIGAGKTHLAYIWQNLAKATYLKAYNLTQTQVATLIEAPNHVVIDEFTAPNFQQEQLLFHLYNVIKGAKKSLLVMSPVSPKSWKISLPDLRSRLSTLGVVSLEDPDDNLIKAIMLKRFSDYQVIVDERTLNYLLHHVERSYPAIHRWIDILYQHSLANHRRITIPLIKQLQETYLCTKSA